jgi:hypothetical protein
MVATRAIGCGHDGFFSRPAPSSSSRITRRALPFPEVKPVLLTLLLRWPAFGQPSSLQLITSISATFGCSHALMAATAASFQRPPSPSNSARFTESSPTRARKTNCESTWSISANVRYGARFTIGRRTVSALRAIPCFTATRCANPSSSWSVACSALILEAMLRT